MTDTPQIDIEEAAREMLGLCRDWNGEEMPDDAHLKETPTCGEMRALLADRERLKEEIEGLRDHQASIADLVQKLDIAIYGVGAAKQASLCDLVSAIPADFAAKETALSDTRAVLREATEALIKAPKLASTTRSGIFSKTIYMCPFCLERDGHSADCIITRANAVLGEKSDDLTDEHLDKIEEIVAPTRPTGWDEESDSAW